MQRLFFVLGFSFILTLHIIIIYNAIKLKWGFDMAQTNISIRIDEDLKRDAEAVFAKIGLTLSAATNVFYRQAVRTQSIPFHLSAAETDSQMQARRQFGEAIRAAQEQSVINGTSEMTLDEINDIIRNTN